MPRIRLALLVAVIASLAIAASAVAAKVTGGTATLTPSTATTTLLSNNHIAVTPLAPATASSNGAITLQIRRGWLNTTTLRGRVALSGGLELTNGTKTVTARRLEIISTKRGAYVWALVRGRSHRVCAQLRRHRHRFVCAFVTRYRSARVAKITAGSVSSGTFTGNIAITQLTANAINRLAGSKVVSAGASFGTISITPTLS